MLYEVITIGGIVLAVIMYRKGLLNPKLQQTAVYKLLSNQYFIPKFYDEFFSKPYAELSRIFWRNSFV